MTVEGQDAREWVIRWEYPIRKHVLVGPVDGRQMEGLIVVPKSRLDAALVDSEARERELQEGLDQAVEMANDNAAEIASLAAREAVLVEALKERQEAIDTAAQALTSSQYVGGLSEREAYRIALTALQNVETEEKGMNPLAGVVEAEPDGSER